MHLKGIQSKYKVTIAWVLMMQCNAMRLKKETELATIYWTTQQQVQKENKSALQYDRSFNLNLAWSVSHKSVTKLI